MGCPKIFSFLIFINMFWHKFPILNIGIINWLLILLRVVLYSLNKQLQIIQINQEDH